MKRKSRTESWQETVKLLNEQLFCVLYPALHEMSRRYDELLPAEIYDEAMRLSRFLMDVPRPDLIKDEVTEMMRVRYAVFEQDAETTQRTDEEIGRTSFLVMVVALYQLVVINKRQEVGRHEERCQMLAEMTFQHELLHDFMERVRETEDEEELKGKRVQIVNLMIQEDEVDKDGLIDMIVDCSLQYKDDVIEKNLLVLSDVNDQNNHRYDMQVERLRAALKKRVEIQSKPHGDIKARNVFMGGSTHNDYSRNLGISGLSDSNKKLLSNE